MTRGTLSSPWNGAAGVRLDPIVRRSRFLDRPTWSATLLRANHLEPVHLEVDAETGMVLSERTDGGTVVEWTELVVGESLAPAHFRWDGPARSAVDEQEARLQEDRDRHEGRRAWLVDQVHDGPLRVTIELGLDAVHALDTDTGSFRAGFGGTSTMLQRRSRSDEVWKAPGQHWSTERWDWAVEVRGSAALSPDALRALQDQLPDR